MQTVRTEIHLYPYVWLSPCWFSSNALSTFYRTSPAHILIQITL